MTQSKFTEHLFDLSRVWRKECGRIGQGGPRARPGAASACFLLYCILSGDCPLLSRLRSNLKQVEQVFRNSALSHVGCYPMLG